MRDPPRLGRLFVLDAYGHIMPHVDWLPGLERMRLHAASMGPFDLRQELCELIADRAFLADQSPVRTRAEFEDRRSAGRERIGLAVQDVASVVDPLLEAYHEARLALERAETGRWRYAMDDMWDQLRNLVPPGFLTATPWPWLAHFPRYFPRSNNAWTASPAAVCSATRSIATTSRRWHGYLAQSEHDRQQGIYDPELTTYRWMLEEYRVSLFAQKLGTAMPISAKRLDRLWEKVSRAEELS